MKVQRIGETNVAGKPRIHARVCFVACLIILTCGTGAGVGHSQEQSAAVPAAPGASTGANAEAHVRELPANQQASDAADADRKAQIVDDCAGLLKLANDLKAEMEKASKDTLSLGVIRKAGQIEQLARKMKGEMKPMVGKN